MFYKYRHKQMKKNPNILDRYSSLLKNTFLWKQYGTLPLGLCKGKEIIYT